MNADLIKKSIWEIQHVEIDTDSIIKLDPMLSIIFGGLNSMPDDLIPVETGPAFDPTKLAATKK